MLILINLVTTMSNALAEEYFKQEWNNIQSNFKQEDFINAKDQEGNLVNLKNKANEAIDTSSIGASQDQIDQILQSAADRPLHDLENKGRMVRLQDKENTKLLNQIEKNLDPGIPGVSQYENFADKLAKQRATMHDSLSKYLKEEYGIDIDCITVPGGSHKMNNRFIIGTEEEEIRDEVYEPKYCEHLSNNFYDCTTDLHINCLKQSHKTLQLDIKEANFGYSQEGNLIHFDHVYVNNRHASKVKKVHYTFHHLGIAELRLVFEIPNVEALDALTLTGINFSHAIFIQFNNHNVYPANWTDLKAQIRESHFFWGRTIRQVGPAYHEVLNHHYRSMSYYDQYPRLDYGTGSLAINVDTRSNNYIDSVDLTRFVKAGHNELIIKGGSIGHSYIRATLHSLEKTCLKWSEKWVETCVLRAS